MQTITKPGFSYKGTVLFITAIGFLFLAGLVNGFGAWQHWFEEPSGVGWLLTANITFTIGFFVTLSHAVAIKLKNRQYCPTCGQKAA